MSFFNNCDIYKRNIPLGERIAHNAYNRPPQNIISLNIMFHDCNPIRNPIINNNNIRNINTIITVFDNYCNSEINLNEIEDHLLCPNFNNNISNESMLDEDDIINLRNIKSNSQGEVIPTDFNYNNITNNNYKSSDYNNNKNIIKDLKVNKIDDISKFKEKICVICLEDFKQNDNYILLQCIHFFHDDCIKEWILNKNICPICKYKIDFNYDN